MDNENDIRIFAQPSHTGVCPSCGYCPHCGRSGQQAQPWYPVYPVYPTMPWYPTTIPGWSYGTGTYITCTSGTAL